MSVKNPKPELPRGCHFTVGTLLTLQSLPHPGTTPSERQFTVEIEKIFLPFTQSQVFKVKWQNPRPEDPEHVVLKLFDRRFSGRSRHPWDESKEDALLQFMADVDNGVSEDDYDGKDADDYEVWDWEKRYRFQNQEHFENERRIYEHLRPLQGSVIPQCHGSVLALNVSRALGFLGEVPGLLLEFVDGNAMDTLEVGVNISHEDAQQAGEKAFDIMRRLREYDVIHCDLRLANFLVTSAHPPHVVIIDFALSRTPDEGETDEEWAEEVRSRDEVHGVRLMLHRHRFREKSPPPPKKGYAGYYHFNRNMDRERPEWREKHYKPVVREGGHVEMIKDEKGGMKEYHHAAWELKHQSLDVVH